MSIIMTVLVDEILVGGGRRDSAEKPHCIFDFNERRIIIDKFRGQSLICIHEHRTNGFAAEFL
jgi:hypothetical protein